jgi:hypothetical protein
LLKGSGRVNRILGPEEELTGVLEKSLRQARRESDLDDIAQSMDVGEAICTKRDVIAVVDRPQDIEDEEAMSFFGGSEGDADESQGVGPMAKAPDRVRGMDHFLFECVRMLSNGGSEFLDC